MAARNPDVPGLRIQAVHSLDVGDAYRRAVVSDVRGPFNLAADPPLDARHLAAAYDARTVPVPLSAFRAAVAVAWHLRVQPTSPDWVDLLVRSPLLDTSRARRELGWAPVHSADAALVEFLEGMWRVPVPRPPPRTRADGSVPGQALWHAAAKWRLV